MHKVFLAPGTALIPRLCLAIDLVEDLIHFIPLVGIVACRKALAASTPVSSNFNKISEEKIRPLYSAFQFPNFQLGSTPGHFC